MNPVGNALIKKEFTATTLWPPVMTTLEGPVDLEKHYKEALAGKLVPVMEVDHESDGYLVIGKSEIVGDFIWQIEGGDVRQFIPVIKKAGMLMPAGLSPIEEFEWLAKNMGV